MRFGWFIVSFGALALLTAGCVPGSDILGSDNSLGAVSGASTSSDSGATVAADSKATDSDTDTPTAQTRTTPTVLAGDVTGAGNYQLFEIGPGVAGDEWRIAPESRASAPFLIVLLDSEKQLLKRQIVTAATPLAHVLRADVATLYAGVAPAYGTDGGSFQFDLALHSGGEVPAPQPQVVWLCFEAGNDVRVQSRAELSFPAFNAAMLGSAYTGDTAAMKAAIVAAMREDYAPYNVVILTSDDTPSPSVPHSTIYFGGSDNRLLGLADSVDQYNTNLEQTAIIYVDSFADFSTMRLSTADMAQMVGNTASHELGHLLGLFHTRDPVDLMDTTGTAWDLARDQDFTVGALETTVFPVGYENEPLRLAETVGFSPNAEKGVTKAESSAKMIHKAELRAAVRQELRHRCGNCLNPDP